MGPACREGRSGATWSAEMEGGREGGRERQVSFEAPVSTFRLMAVYYSEY